MLKKRGGGREERASEVEGMGRWEGGESEVGEGELRVRRDMRERRGGWRGGQNYPNLSSRVKDLDNREESAHQLRSMKRKRKFFSRKVLLN